MTEPYSPHGKYGEVPPSDLALGGVFVGCSEVNLDVFPSLASTSLTHQAGPVDAAAGTLKGHAHVVEPVLSRCSGSHMTVGIADEYAELNTEFVPGLPASQLTCDRGSGAHVASSEAMKDAEETIRAIAGDTDPIHGREVGRNVSKDTCCMSHTLLRRLQWFPSRT